MFDANFFRRIFQTYTETNILDIPAFEMHTNNDTALRAAAASSADKVSSFNITSFTLLKKLI